jgi:hypothetical protein
MMNIKISFIASLLSASASITTASNLFNTFRGKESNDTKNNSIVPVDKSSTNHSDKNTNARFMAKQLLKSAYASTILGKTSNILERYGYYTSVNGTFLVILML